MLRIAKETCVNVKKKEKKNKKKKKEVCLSRDSNAVLLLS